ncbi:LPS translocon maturation chaperone LptM [Tepidimonas alkaliphilus]|uniref:LPS translocon maturation chaperone LptM n=1 Tax=Tepidimonas alkaliphilus TaxID=2588942 RepID=UPI00319E50A4
MPPTRWLSMSASVSSLRRSQFSSTALSTASARSRYSLSVIVRIAAMLIRLRIVGCGSVALAAALAMTLAGCGQKGPLTLPASATFASAISSPASTSVPQPDVPR